MKFYVRSEIHHDQIKRTTFEDAKALSALYEEHEYEKRKRMGLSWSPVRAELYDLYRARDDALERVKRLVRKLCWIVFADTAALAALSIVLFILR